MWNWQQQNWPNFSYDPQTIAALETEFLTKSGELIGISKHIDQYDKELLKIELLSEEAFKTSKIEGEMLSRNSLQSSIRRHFGLQTDNRKIPPAEQGIATMTVDLYQHFQQPLSHELLWKWHTMLMNGRINLDNIGNYRSHEEAMQVISGPLHKPVIHFEAPPSKGLKKQMTHFITWFNQSAPGETKPLPALTRAAIAHLHFVCIHPFEDGNGRIGRAIAEQSLAQSLGYPTLIALADTIEHHKKDYYNALEANNKHNEITPWIDYFARTILTAQQRTQQRIEFIIAKTKLYDRLRGKLNQRQEKVLARMFAEGIDGFKGGLSANNYASITGAPRATVTRDLQQLVAWGALTKTGELRYTRYCLNNTYKA